jgi:hypothetical protein
MSSGQLSAVLAQQLTRTLAETAFMLVESEMSYLPKWDTVIEAGVEFSGEQRGCCWLTVDESGADGLAREMLGSEGEVEPEYRESAVAELLNIFTGWLLEAYFGHDSEHRMGTPTAARKSLEAAVASRLAREYRAIVSTDAGHVFVCGLTFES